MEFKLSKSSMIDFNALSCRFHLPITQVARELGICPTMLKKVCRRNGIPRWPYRQLKSINRMIAALESDICTQNNAAEIIEELKKKKEAILGRASLEEPLNSDRRRFRKIAKKQNSSSISLPSFSSLTREPSAHLSDTPFIEPDGAARTLLSLRTSSTSSGSTQVSLHSSQCFPFQIQPFSHSQSAYHLHTPTHYPHGSQIRSAMESTRPTSIRELLNPPIVTKDMNVECRRSVLCLSSKVLSFSSPQPRFLAPPKCNTQVRFYPA